MWVWTSADCCISLNILKPSHLVDKKGVVEEDQVVASLVGQLPGRFGVGVLGKVLVTLLLQELIWRWPNCYLARLGSLVLATLESHDARYQSCCFMMWLPYSRMLITKDSPDLVIPRVSSRDLLSVRIT